MVGELMVSKGEPNTAFLLAGHRIKLSKRVSLYLQINEALRPHQMSFFV